MLTENLLHHRALLLASIAAASLACTPAEGNAGDGVAANFETISALDCPADQKRVFAGEVEDDFGLSLTVCLSSADYAAERRITIRYSGEGGGGDVSCQPAQCADIVKFNHYVRPRFSILTLEWRDQNGLQKIVETFDAQSLGSEPTHIVSHSWTPIDSANGDDSTKDQLQSYLVAPCTQPLALLALDPVIGSSAQ